LFCPARPPRSEARARASSRPRSRGSRTAAAPRHLTATNASVCRCTRALLPRPVAGTYRAASAVPWRPGSRPRTRQLAVSRLKTAQICATSHDQGARTRAALRWLLPMLLARRWGFSSVWCCTSAWIGQAARGVWLSNLATRRTWRKFSFRAKHSSCARVDGQRAPPDQRNKTTQRVTL
jgi:hypothetical protein